MLSKFRYNANRLTVLCCFVTLYIVIILLLSLIYREKVDIQKHKLSIATQE